RVDPLFQPLSKKGQANVISRPSLSNGQQVIRKLAKNKLAMLGLFIITALVAMAIIGPNLVPYSYSDQSLLTKNQEVSSEHWFGTDELG
ncbi:ABC transporter permease, partial [Winogradskyella sp. ZXX205]|nr:ABC transporter permease [Winogradskyella ouciana]